MGGEASTSKSLTMIKSSEKQANRDVTAFRGCWRSGGDEFAHRSAVVKADIIVTFKRTWQKQLSRRFGDVA